MYLTSWEEKGYTYDEIDNIIEQKEKHSWKGYSFDVLNELTEKGYLFPSNYKNKSVTLTNAGIEFARTLIEKYINKEL